MFVILSRLQKIYHLFQEILTCIYKIEEILFISQLPYVKLVVCKLVMIKKQKEPCVNVN